MINMYSQTSMRLAGIILLILSIIILMSTYGVLAKPFLGSELIRSYIERESIYYGSSLILSVLLLTLGTFLTVFPFKETK